MGYRMVSALVSLFVLAIYFFLDNAFSLLLPLEFQLHYHLLPQYQLASLYTL
jgi:hypothetical protein